MINMKLSNEIKCTFNGQITGITPALQNADVYYTATETQDTQAAVINEINSATSVGLVDFDSTEYMSDYDITATGNSLNIRSARDFERLCLEKVYYTPNNMPTPGETVRHSCNEYTVKSVTTGVTVELEGYGCVHVSDVYQLAQGDIEGHIENIKMVSPYHVSFEVVTYTHGTFSITARLFNSGIDYDVLARFATIDIFKPATKMHIQNKIERVFAVAQHQEENKVQESEQLSLELEFTESPIFTADAVEFPAQDIITNAIRYQGGTIKRGELRKETDDLLHFAITLANDDMIIVTYSKHINLFTCKLYTPLDSMGVDCVVSLRLAREISFIILKEVHV